ncbi:ERBB receptor feedback inhibitor 1 [Rhineura floridana]|uniref:ERBB receptor feedback inhibitor 1 n=1 Tax=Rhineura floridana TaxID=261503 RepID=UPI002AC8368D|nr:ERBB receptor feedback inhibitor 1 [Rhineura floridana]
MSAAGVAAQEMRGPLKNAFLHSGQGVGSLKPCWGVPGGGSGGQFENAFFSIDPVTTGYSLNSSGQHHLMSMGHISAPDPVKSRSHAQKCCSVLPLKPSPSSERTSSSPEDHGVVPGFSRLSVTMSGVSDEAAPPPPTPIGKSGLPAFVFSPAPSGERSARPLPPLPIPEDFVHDDADREVEFLTSSDTDILLGDCSSPAFKPSAQGRRSFRGCGQINYAYFDTPADPELEEPPSALAKQQNGCPASACPLPPPPPPPHQLHRRLRRSHSGPAGSFNKPVVKVSSHFHRASPSSDDDRPEVPPRVPIPPRVLKPDYRRWSAEVASNSYSDDDKPPKVPPRGPLSRSNSRTPSPKSLPLYLNGIMPPTQSFAPDPKYVSSKALQRQHSEGSAASSSNKVPCILPIIENGKKVSSTHYYLLPERPPYLDKYEKFFQEAEETSLHLEGRQQLWNKAEEDAAKLALMVKADLVGPVKRKHLPCMVSP